MKRFFLFATVAACMLMFGSSCLKSGNTTNPQQGAFLLCNASPDAPPLGVLINNVNLSADSLSYGLHSIYIAETAGSYSFSFGTTAKPNVTGKTVTISPNTYYSYFLVDSFSKIKSEFIQDNIIVPGSDSVYIRFFNFCPDAGELNMRDSSTTPTINYSSRSFNDQETTNSYASFNEVKAGVYTLKLTQPDGSTVATLKDTLVGSHVYTYFAKGFLHGTGTQSVGIGKITNF